MRKEASQIGVRWRRGAKVNMKDINGCTKDSGQVGDGEDVLERFVNLDDIELVIVRKGGGL